VRVIVVGGGLTGLALARSLRRRGLEPTVLERMPPGSAVPRPFMLPYHGYAALEDAGAMAAIRAMGWDIAPRPDGEPVAVAVDFVRAVAALAEGVPVEHGQEVVGLLRDGERVVGARVRRNGREIEMAADLLVACDGVRSPVRSMAALEGELTQAEGGHLSFMSPAVIDRPFAMAYQSDGRQVGLLGWPQGSAGWWDVDRVGRDAALAPGLDAFRRAFARLLPAAEPALAALTSMDQVAYREVTEVRCPRWWSPGVLVIGDAAHFIGPEAGIGAGLGLGDALALAVAIERNPGDPDAACADYEGWRRPATRPYEQIGAAGGRLVPAGAAGARPTAERWPPVD
jgi:2-polyprenyl-6-methoxyphenol hydroxylase-like FAD-dependent oxidoreductase